MPIYIKRDKWQVRVKIGNKDIRRLFDKEENALAFHQQMEHLKDEWRIHKKVKVNS